MNNNLNYEDCDNAAEAREFTDTDLEQTSRLNKRHTIPHTAGLHAFPRDTDFIAITNAWIKFRTEHPVALSYGELNISPKATGRALELKIIAYEALEGIFIKFIESCRLYDTKLVVLCENNVTWYAYRGADSVNSFYIGTLTGINPMNANDIKYVRDQQEIPDNFIIAFSFISKVVD